MAKRITKLASSRGAAIMLALWALFLLSAMIISWALDINTRLVNAGNTNRVLEAEAMACSGSEIALHPGVKPGSPVLRGSLAPGRNFEARITGEAGRLNLKFILTGEDPAKLEILRKYLEIKGVDLNERDEMIDCLLDWVDPDNLIRLNGAEDEQGYKAANRMLTSLDDLKRVRGWEEFTSRPDWDADFTLKSLDHKINVNWASRDVLLALPGVTDAAADRIIEMRRGPDGIDGTEDDFTFKPADVQVALGLPQAQYNQLAGLLTFDDQILRVVSIGKSGSATRTVQLVFRKGSNILLTWKEL